MKMTNRLALTAILVLALSIASFAQRGSGERPSPEERAKQQTAHLTEVLELSDEQAKEIAAISVKYMEQGHEAREKARKAAEKERETMKAEREKMNKARNAELKKVLTELQYAKYEGMIAEREHGRKGKKHKRKNRKGKE